MSEWGRAEGKEGGGERVSEERDISQAKGDIKLRAKQEREQRRSLRN